MDEVRDGLIYPAYFDFRSPVVMHKRQKENYSFTVELTVLTTTDNADNPVIFFPDNEQNWVKLSEEDCRLAGNPEKWNGKTLSGCFDKKCEDYLLHPVTL